MPISQEIAPHLPHLRRFSRTLSGSQDSGDAYVVAVLEALVADPSIFPADLPARLGLYQIFLKMWNSLDDVHTVLNFDPAENEAVHSIQTITPLPRQAFLLLSVEGFSPEEIAIVLGVDVGGVAELIEQADQEIAEQLPQSAILIIEDEPLTAASLQLLVESLGHRVTGIARTHHEAVERVKEEQPELILSDIQLEDGSSGVEAVNEILGSLDLPVIFITGHPELLLTGERPEPAFLIAKPFDPKTVKAIISQALFFDVRTHKGKDAAA
ncbi:MULTISPECIES: response regulator [Rhodomicrobium]|uniref:response regulator n=1 Tax=Rhodomicrobium TaxID=1068 RepID=UPI000B4A90ED|nr:MULTISPECIES: response regulator [Rhodomicrobium]